MVKFHLIYSIWPLFFVTEVLGYVEAEPDFSVIMAEHDQTKAISTKDYKQASSAAALLALSPSIFALITSNVCIDVDDGGTNRKINVGLRLKQRQYVNMANISKFFSSEYRLLDLLLTSFAAIVAFLRL